MVLDHFVIDSEFFRLGRNQRRTAFTDKDRSYTVFISWGGYTPLGSRLAKVRGVANCKNFHRCHAMLLSGVRLRRSKPHPGCPVSAITATPSRSSRMRKGEGSARQRRVGRRTLQTSQIIAVDAHANTKCCSRMPLIRCPASANCRARIPVATASGDEQRDGKMDQHHMLRVFCQKNRLDVVGIHAHRPLAS